MAWSNGFGQGVSGLALAVLASSALHAEPMTLAQALEAGLARSPEVGQAQARVGAAEAARDGARREWLPNLEVDAAAGLRHLQNDARVRLGLSAIDEKPAYLTVALDQPVFDFGRRSTLVKAQKARLGSAEQDELVASEGAAYTIAKAYLQASVQGRVVKAARDNLAFHEALAADVGEGVARGAMSISEKQQADERLQRARLSLTQALGDLATTRDELALLIGRVGFDLVEPESSARALPATLDDALSIASTSDPRLRSLEQRLAAARWEAKRVGADRWPTLGLRGTYRTGKDFEGYAGQTNDYEGLVIMRWNVFDGGVTAAKEREAEHGADEARFALAAGQRDSELEVRKAWIGLQTWRSRLEQEQARQAVAAQVLESYRAQFGIGRRSLLDLLDAQNALYGSTVDAEIARVGTQLAEYGLLVRLNKLREHFGVDRKDVDPGQYGPK